MTVKLDIAYERVRLADMLIAKALKLSEVARIARLELMLREYLEAKWIARSVEAAEAAGAVEKAEAVDSAVAKVMAKWPADVRVVVERDIESIFKLAYVAAYRKGTGQSKSSLQYDGKASDMLKVSKAKGEVSIGMDFNLEDQGAIDALKKRNMFWIGEHYEKNVSAAIAKTARETLIAGKSRREASAAMQKAIKEQLGQVRPPAGFRGTQKAYFEGVVANATTVARAYGQMRAFKEIGVTHYVIVNPGDEKTCPICGHMNGKVFEVKQGIAQMSKELSAKTPSALKSAHPWPSVGSLKALSPSAGKATKTDSKALAGGGLALPPYHFKCRCTPDIDFESADYSKLQADAPEKLEEATEAPETKAYPLADGWKERVREMNKNEDKTGSSYGRYHLRLVKLSDIDIPEPWSGSKLKNAVSLLEEGTPLPPIKVFLDAESGLYEIVDGIHRSNASRAAGYTHIHVLESELVER